MKVIEPYYYFPHADFEPISVSQRIKSDEKFLEYAGRIANQSHDIATQDSAEEFLKNLLTPKNGIVHKSVIEHRSFSVVFVCDRGISHEIVRHRIASYTQESTRYCNYAKAKFGSEITVIKPCFFKEGTHLYDTWYQSCLQAERAYFELLKHGATPQQARSVLPNSLKTKLLVTMNYSAWRHFFKLRTDSAAHPQMRELTIPLLKDLREISPVLFGDINSHLFDTVTK